MTHDFSLVFDTESPYWQKVLDIFNKNEKYEKKVVSNRNLHHKFPRSFSKKLGEPVDNDKDNLISLSLADHFLVHYYYYLLAKKGYRQAMATAFIFMARKSIKYITPETAEAIAKDFDEAKCIADQASRKNMTGENNPMYGKTHSEETCKKLSEQRKGKKYKSHSEETRKKISESLKGKTVSEETCQKLSSSLKGKPAWNKDKTHSEETKQKMREAWERRKVKLSD